MYRLAARFQGSSGARRWQSGTRPLVIRWLDSLKAVEADRLGGKAARLGELAAAGLPVPPGFVVEPEAYDAFVEGIPELKAFLAAAEERTAAEVERVVTDLFMGGPMPEAVEEGLRAAYETLSRAVRISAPPVAVRSSALGEDSEAASFAGQQVTYLNAVGPDLVLACLRGCWAGLWSERASAYRKRLATGGTPRMAVLVQLLITPEVAGVAFTVNPVTGERDELIVDAAWGLGEAVVSGRATPDHVRVDKLTGEVRAYVVGAKEMEVVPDVSGVAERQAPAERRTRRALKPEAINALASLARQVEAHFGAPQDLEWAWEQGQMYLLQARPITALPPAPPPGGWKSPEPNVVWERRNFAEHLPGPISEVAGTLILPAVGEAVVALARSIGYSLSRPAFVTIGGYAYARESMRRRLDFPLRWASVYARMFLAPASRWQREPRGTHERRVAPLLEKLPDAQDAPAIVAWCEAMVREFARTWTDVHRLSGGWRWSELALSMLVGGNAGTLLQGFEGPAQALERQAAALALRATPEIAEALNAPEPLAALEALGPAAEAFRQELATFTRDARKLTASFDPAQPLPYEDAAAVCRLVAMRIHHAGEAPDARQAALAAERRAAEDAVRASLTGWRRPAFDKLLQIAQDFAVAREAALAELGHGWYELRRQLQVLGDWLLVHEAIEEAENVFDLKWEEIRAFVVGGPEPGLMLIAARHDERIDAARLTPPLVIGGEPARVHARAGAISGAPGSPGRVTGVARVVLDMADFDSLAPGEILVAPATTPAWTPLFHRAAAVVTDVGGPLSHGSIVAREFRIPAVLGTASATRRVRTGDVITVDGDRGLVWRAGGG